MALKVIGLDTSSFSTGYSVFNDGKLVSYGLIKPPKKYIMPRRLYHFSLELQLLLNEHSPDEIVIEDLKHRRNVKVVNTLASFIGVARLITFCSLGKDAHLVSPSEVKMPATGKGNADKQEVIAAANKRFALSLSDQDDDIADAIYVAQAYMGEKDGRAIKKGKKPTKESK